MSKVCLYRHYGKQPYPGTSCIPSLTFRKGNSFHKQVVYPNVVQHKGEDNGFTKEAKGIQTESFPEKFDEGTQCEEERVVVHTRGIQTSPNSSIGKKTQHPVQNLPPAVTPLMQSTAPQLTDAVTLIASTAAAAAVAASASLHNNDKHSKVCLLKQLYLYDINFHFVVVARYLFSYSIVS